MLATLARQLDEMLLQLPRRRRVTLLLLCVERFVGLYEEFYEVTGFGRPTMFRQFLNTLWNGTSESADPDQLLEFFPHGEDYPWPETNVLHCIGSIVFAAMQHAHDDFHERNSFGSAWVELLSIGPAQGGNLHDLEGALSDLVVTHSAGFVAESRAFCEDYLALANTTDEAFQVVVEGRQEAAKHVPVTFRMLDTSLGTWGA